MTENVNDFTVLYCHAAMAAELLKQHRTKLHSALAPVELLIDQLVHDMGLIIDAQDEHTRTTLRAQIDDVLGRTRAMLAPYGLLLRPRSKGHLRLVQSDEERD